MKKMVWLNTTTIPTNVLEIIRNSEGLAFVVSNTVDVRPFLDDVDAVQSLVNAGKLVFHKFFPSWKDQWKKPLFSTAIQKTVAVGKVAELIPEAEELGKVIDSVAIPREIWEKDEISFTDTFPEELLNEIGLFGKVTRSQVYEHCQNYGRPDIRDQYDAWYIKMLAYQHGCQFYLGADGEVVPV